VSSPVPRTISSVLILILFRPFKIVGGSEGKPLVEVESGGKTAKYVRLHQGFLLLEAYPPS
jgi:hypothetical protein